MDICVTTSNAYKHLIPIFCFLFNKFWDSKQRVEIVGYDQPPYNLPSNFHFVSLGKQTEDKQNFTRDLRKYFSKKDKYIIWMMEDTFLRKPVDFKSLNLVKSLTEKFTDVGRVNLTREGVKQDHSFLANVGGYDVFQNDKFSIYRLSTQPSIWNKHFALQYMAEDLTPWEFECQSDHAVDEFKILGLDRDAPVKHNEGVRKHNLYDYNFDGIDQSIIDEMNSLGLITKHP
jgi:hypothetical protein